MCEYCEEKHCLVEDRIECILWRAENGREIGGEDVQWLCYEIAEITAAYYTVKELLGDFMVGIQDQVQKAEKAMREA